MTRDTSPFRPGHRVAALVGVAFVVGLGWGVARTTAQPGTRTFTGEAGMVISHVKAGQATAFERTMERMGEALALSEEFDRRRQAVTWKIYKAADPLDGGALLYISVLDPVVPGADYWVPQILNEAFPTEVQVLYDTYAGAFEEEQGQLLMNLTAVDLGLVAAEPLLGSSFAPTSEAAAQPALGFTGGTGIVLNVVNPAKTADFERVMRAFGESLVGSSDAQRQQMGEGLKLYRAAEVGPNNYALYYLLADPAVSGGNYAVAQVLADEYMGGPPENGDEVREIYEAYSGALEGGGQQTINLDLVMEF